MEFSKEQIKKAKNCATLEEFKTLAKAEGFDLTEEEAENYFSATRGGELSDDDLDKISGGTKYSTGVDGPEGYHNYAIVTLLNAAPKKCFDKGVLPINRRATEEDVFYATTCGTCKYRFTKNGISYCSKRWEWHDHLD